MVIWDIMITIPGFHCVLVCVDYMYEFLYQLTACY